jgi:hypothetical protein
MSTMMKLGILHKHELQNINCSTKTEHHGVTYKSIARLPYMWRCVNSESVIGWFVGYSVILRHSINCPH